MQKSADSQLYFFPIIQSISWYWNNDEYRRVISFHWYFIPKWTITSDELFLLFMQMWIWQHWMWCFPEILDILRFTICITQFLEHHFLVNFYFGQILTFISLFCQMWKYCREIFLGWLRASRKAMCKKIFLKSIVQQNKYFPINVIKIKSI